MLSAEEVQAIINEIQALKAKPADSKKKKGAAEDKTELINERV